MNQYDELYVFRQAKLADVDRLMSFIRKHWRSNHIFGNDRDFFVYEHGDGDDVNFILCENKQHGDIVGMHGFIPYSLNEQLRHICGCMTMVKKDVPIPMLGVELIKRFIVMTGYKTYCGIGTNPNTMVPLVKRLFRRHVGKMEHYYRLNDRVENFRIAKISNSNSATVENFTVNDIRSAQLVALKSFDDVTQKFTLNQSYRFLPYKEDWYIEKRYFNHPIYNYKVWGVSIDDVVCALLIGRCVEMNEAKILRFVDFIGEIENLSLIADGVKEIIESEEYEYADFLLCNVPEQIMNRAGFLKKVEDSGIIIPNYFEPFVQSNVEVWYETSDEDMILFRADADADRPNQRQGLNR
jgi:hypothetical protein